MGRMIDSIESVEVIISFSQPFKRKSHTLPSPPPQPPYPVRLKGEALDRVSPITAVSNFYHSAEMSRPCYLLAKV